MMLQGVSLSLVAWGRYYNNWDGQMLVIFILAVAACEAAIALALVLMLFQRSGNLDMTFWQATREDNLQPFVDHEVPDDPHPRQKWPQLVPAGVEPEADEEETVHRTHV
jgi:NADH-quinone oxidoreductase subunit K